jgi:FkbH-like protein
VTERIRRAAKDSQVDVLNVDRHAGIHGLAAWHSRSFWHSAKMEIAPRAAPLYGDLVARIIAAFQGRSYKALVLDLDNTLWGGVIGDDSIEGIAIGQGSPTGEAFSSFQDYARELSRRGVILAVCSKNDESTAMQPFKNHPEMVLRLNDLAYFCANWDDKVQNLKKIASALNIGLDSLAFVDDNPFERNLVRRELPMAAVPEIGEESADYPAIVSAAGYFESLTLTDEDRSRSGQYQGNIARAALQASTTDLGSYLRELQMSAVVTPFDRIGLQRIVQLINKTNQFNLTTRRHTEVDVLEVVGNPRSFGLQMRLTDRFGDNGIVALVIGKMQDAESLLIDTWVMSCRVLGRQVEEATLNLVVDEARLLGATQIIGEFLPTKKNGMVKDHYSRLGFSTVSVDESGAYRGALMLDGYVPRTVPIEVRRN